MNFQRKFKENLIGQITPTNDSQAQTYGNMVTFKMFAKLPS